MNAILDEIRQSLSDDTMRGLMRSRSPFHMPGAIADPRAILSIDDLEQAFARGAIPLDDLKLYASDRNVAPAKLGIARGNRIRPLALSKFMAQGTTFAATNLQHVFPQLWALTCAVERWLDDRASIAAVASFGPSGFALHYDPQDIIIVQLRGTKHWTLFGEPLRGSASHTHADKSAETTVRTEVTMQAGDLLFVPSGLRHRCRPEGVSLHLGIIIEHASGIDLVENLARYLRTDLLLNEPLQRFLGPDAMALRLAAIKARIAELLDGVDPVQWLDEQVSSEGRPNGIAFTPPAPDAPGAIAELTFSMGPARTADGLWKVAGVTMEPTAEAARVIALLRAGPAAVDDLIAQGLREALTALVDKGVVRIVLR